MYTLNKRQKTTIIAIFIIIAIAIWYYQNNKDNEQLILNQSNLAKTTDLQNGKEENQITVYVTGAVKKQGVVQLKEGSRIQDAIDKAEGLEEDAYIETINLAYMLEDGMKIYIPNMQDKQNLTKEEMQISKDNTKNYITNDSSINISNVNQSQKENRKEEKININNATQSQLETLPGIGAATAIKIINYRKENGKFSNIEDIKNVSGIGEEKFKKIKELISV